MNRERRNNMISYTQDRIAELAGNIRVLAKLHRENEHDRNIKICLDGTADALEGLIWDKCPEFDEKQIRKKLSGKGIKAGKISFARLGDGRLRAEIRAGTRKGCMNTGKLGEIMSEITGCSMVAGKDGRNIVSVSEAEYVFEEETAYTEMHGSAVMSKQKGEISGDSYTFENGISGKVVMAVADGMGTGNAASKKSTMVIELIEELFKSGYEETCIPEMINSAIIKNNEESTVTMDMAAVNLNTGRATIVKMGGAATFILKDGNVTTLSPSSLPAGVIENVETDVWKEQLTDGSYIIMLSDGVADSLPFYDKEERLVKIIKSMRHRNPERMARHILTECRSFCTGENTDDMTVLVMGVWKTKGLQTLKS